jgi:hypothetical protein
VASSLGTARTDVPVLRAASPRVLGRSAFVAGSLGRASFDAASERDEAAWLGYTAFDPRPVAAEIALLRSAMREIWRGGGEPRFTTLFVSSARPSGTFTMVPRASSLLVHLGPGEGWGPALRTGVAAHLMNAWIGRELRLLPREGAERTTAEAETGWFHDGFARLMGAQTLAALGLLTPDEASAFVGGLLSVQATSPYAGKRSTEVAARAASDPRARADLTARGALHALRVAALLRKNTSGPRALSELLRSLLGERTAPRTMTVEAWSDIVARALGAKEAKAFADGVLEGAAIALPPDALGPCFRARLGEYVGYDLGFDARATIESRPAVVRGIDPKGPAALAGVREGDVLVDLSFAEARPREPVRLVVTRPDPAGEKRLEIRYEAVGVKRRGSVWSRAPGVAPEACGTVL